MGKKKIGLLLRSYAKKEEDVPSVVERALKSIEHASKLRDRSYRTLFSSILVLVPRDYDCGLTADLIREQIARRDFSTRVMVAKTDGHHSCGTLNSGINFLESRENLDYAVIISNKAIEALTTDAMEAMIEAFDHGAKVVGVAVDELQDVVLEGRIQNTFAGWDVKALCEVGGFDSEKGVEEIAPTVRLVRQYGPCIAVLNPNEKPALDIRKTADGDARHKEVMTTKIARQLEEAQRVGADFSFIKSGIMPGYPKKV